MASVTLKGIHKSYDDVDVIHDVDLDIGDGEFVVFVGPSGCGKSTLLRMIAGLEDITGGDISIADSVVNEVAPSKRGVAMVFQSYALYPHMTVYRNMAFGLQQAKLPAGEIDQRVRAAAEVLHITDYLDRTPKALSGGQRQRVAIGRAIVREPEVFLFDEPLSNLDAALRVNTRLEIARLHQRLGTTMIYVTHDQVEAMTLADKIVVLRDGIVEQVGSPRALYERPQTLFVAQFIGSPKMNILDGETTSKGFSLKGHGVLPHEITNKASLVKCGIRPEHITVSNSPADVSGEVVLYEYLGSDCYIYVDCENLGVLTVRVDDKIAYQTGQNVHLSFARERLHFFDAAGQAGK